MTQLNKFVAQKKKREEELQPKLASDVAALALLALTLRRRRSWRS